MVWWLLGTLLLFTTPAHAACTGSGLTWACASGSTEAQVQAAMDAATDGATITFANGTYNFSTTGVTFNNAAGVTLICATVQGCTVTAGTNHVFWSEAFSGTNTKLYRVSGFIIDCGGTGSYTGSVYFYGVSGTVSNIRVDHNKFTNQLPATISILFGNLPSTMVYYGLIDHNLFENSDQNLPVHYISSFVTAPASSPLGTANNVFLEDNDINFAAQSSCCSGGCIDNWTGRFVIRFNRALNCQWTSHGVTHGGGPANMEIYGNATEQNANAYIAYQTGYRNIHQQGAGELTIWSNSWKVNGTKAASGVLATQHYRDINGPSMTATSVAVSGGTTTFTGTFTGCGADACTGAFYAGGFSAANNGNWFGTSSTATTISGPTRSGQFSETPGGAATLAFGPLNDVAVHFQATLCDGNVTGTYYGPYQPDGNRSPIATYRGYPCFRQPGRDFQGNLKPMYAWNNYWTDTLAKIDLTVEDYLGYFSEHFQENRDWYNAVSKDAQTTSSSPFDGTVGVGFGTLANRPATCTATPEAADAGYGGVAYFATDQGSWNQSASNPYGVNFNGADGVLYHCDSTNHWAVAYTPYTYPHPLQGASFSVEGSGLGLKGGKGLGLF